jgi:tetratricopeptide (TPR) repeat protein
MARFEKSRPKSAKPHAAVAPRPRASTAPSIEDTMFFPRLRRHARWMFLLLALVFALGFVGFGVGAGGIGFGDILKGSGGSSGAPSVADAQKKVNENPKDPQAFRDLATALETEGNTTDAIDALQNYSLLKPKNADALRELAGLYLQQATTANTRAQNAQLREAYMASAGTVDASIVFGGSPLIPDPITNAVSSQIEQELQAALSDQQQAAAGAVRTYKRVVALSPNDPNVQLELANAAAQANDSKTEIAAYEKFLKLAPNDPSAPFVRSQLKSLKASKQG